MIPRLEDMSFGTRFVLTIVIVIIVLLALSIVGFLTGGWEAESEPRQGCVDERTRDEIRELTLSAIDNAFQNHIALLFDVWVKDPIEQPKRATNGMQANISAYLRARHNAMDWNPTPC